MKCAIIPPISHLEESSNREYHLLLSHLTDHPRYSSFYGHLDRPVWLTLDNGAHENQSGEGPRRLGRIAYDYQVQEVVLPDYLFNADETVHLTTAALKAIIDEEDLLPNSVRRLMFVPQGKDIWDYRRCLYHLIVASREYACGYQYTIGVSKDYEVFDGGLFELLKRDILPVAEDLDYDVHLLGWGRDLWALGEIGRHFGNRIRSIDSAKPFVYGIYEVSLAWYLTEDRPDYPKRPPDYFTCEMTKGQLDDARKNVEVFDLLAQGTRMGVAAKRVNDHWLLKDET